MISFIANTSARFGFNPKEIERFIKFVTVGFIGFLVDFGVLNLTRPFWLWLAPTEAQENITFAIGTVFSFMMAVCSNFIWNRYWTYPDSRSKPIAQQFAQFAMVNFAGFLARPTFVFLTRSWFGQLTANLLPSLPEETATLIGDNVCVATIVFLVMFWNFFVNRYWTYRDVDQVAEKDPFESDKTLQKMTDA